MSVLLKNAFVGSQNIGDISSNVLCLSLKKIKNEYSGDCLRLVRSSDNSQRDFGFDASGSVDSVAISEWGGSDILKIAQWYDQSGYCNNAVQTDFSRQPIWDNINFKIVFSGEDTPNLYIPDSPTLNFSTFDFSLVLQASLYGYYNYGSSINVPLTKGSATWSFPSYGFVLESNNNFYFKVGANVSNGLLPALPILNKKTNIIGIQKNSVGGSLYFDDLFSTNDTNINPTNLNDSALLIGYDGTTRFANMDCYGVLLFRKALSDYERGLFDV